jgi:AraC-like DNA-binding protein
MINFTSVDSLSLKYYRQVHPEDASLSFDLKRMEDIYDRVQGQPDEPHRHGYYTILWVEEAKGNHRIDFHDFSLGKRQIYFIEPGQIHQVVEEGKSYGFVLTFSKQFLVENNIKEDLIRDLFIKELYGYAPPLTPDEQYWKVMRRRIEEMEQVLESPGKYRYEAVGALLKLFLIHSSTSCDMSSNQNTQEAQSSSRIVRLFKNLLNQKYDQWHKVAEYASHLHITSDYLNNVLKSVTGRGAKEHIQDRIITEARRLFLFTDLNVKEVGYELGFNEPAHFSSFFKKCMGVSPSVYLKS